MGCEHSDPLAIHFNCEVPFTYTIKVSNIGDQDLINAQITDTLPSGIHITGMITSHGWCYTSNSGFPLAYSTAIVCTKPALTFLTTTPFTASNVLNQAMQPDIPVPTTARQPCRRAMAVARWAMFAPHRPPLVQSATPVPDYGSVPASYGTGVPNSLKTVRRT